MCIWASTYSQYSKECIYMAVSQIIETRLVWFKLHSAVLNICENLLQYILKNRKKEKRLQQRNDYLNLI